MSYLDDAGLHRAGDGKWRAKAVVGEYDVGNGVEVLVESDDGFVVADVTVWVPDLNELQALRLANRLSDCDSPCQAGTGNGGTCITTELYPDEDEQSILEELDDFFNTFVSVYNAADLDAPFGVVGDYAELDEEVLYY